jgi:MYXO-CTERM domain-containing protein
MKWSAQVKSLAALSLVCVASPATAKTMIDYFQPIPIVGQLSTTGWGASTVGPHDPSNGMENSANYFYWDGKIIKASDGKYHLFCSRWPASYGIGGWMGVSIAVHAVSDNALGPYTDKGQLYTYSNGKGHNTTGLTVADGTYGVVESAIVPGWLFTSPSLDGPWTYRNSIAWNNNGHNPDAVTSNLQITVGPDNRYWAISSHGFVMDSDQFLGTYKIETDRIYPIISGMNDPNAEDPIIWYSGGFWHVVYNYWDARKGYHLMSVDGIHSWKNMGVALDRSTNFIRYTDGTVNHWGNMERPNVIMENGHVVYFTFAVTDQNKDQANNCCATASKVLVVPFDGVSFDADNGGQGGSGGAGGSGGSAAGGAGGRGIDAGAGGSGGKTGPDGTGGTSAAGGAASGGRSGSGGASGGSSDTTGRTGSGGTNSAGTTGNSGSGGSPGAGGANGTGGAGSGGTTSSAGTTGNSGSGGSPGSGGATGTGGAGSGGTTRTAGSSSGGSTVTATSATKSSSGCSCATNEAQGSNGGGLVLVLGLAIAFAARRYARKRRPSCSASCDLASAERTGDDSTRRICVEADQMLP